VVDLVLNCIADDIVKQTWPMVHSLGVMNYCYWVNPKNDHKLKYLFKRYRIGEKKET
jgi:hypothetical protein